jgi:hypothetical protein
MSEEALAPFADDFSTSIESCRDLVVAQTLGGQQNHPGSHDFEIWQRISGGSPVQFSGFCRR